MMKNERSEKMTARELNSTLEPIIGFTFGLRPRLFLGKVSGSLQKMS
jgi:hypothetical protein